MIKNILSGDKHYLHSNFEAVNLYPALIWLRRRKIYKLAENEYFYISGK